MKSLTRVLILTFIVCVIFVYVITSYLFHEKIGNVGDSSSKVRTFAEKRNSDLSVHSEEFKDGTHHITEINKNLHLYTSPKTERLQQIVLAVVACGDRLAETLVMIKSALVFTKSPLMVVVFADDLLIPSFKEKLNEWRVITNSSFIYEVHPVTFPLQGDTDEWRRLFKPCASQRLFLPTVLPHIDSLLYVDTDTLFLGPVEDVWQHFNLMNTSQIAALTPEHEDPNTGWYNRFARHPFYGKLGVNSGVMLMNLTRMRSFSWTSYVVPIYKEYKLKITWGDQDIINIIFHFHPDKLYIYPCRYNYRPDHCMYMSVCHSADEDGVAVLHGSRGSFHATKHPLFKAIYKAMEEYQLGSEIYSNLYLPMKYYLDSAAHSNCGKVKHIFTRTLEKYARKNDLR